MALSYALCGTRYSFTHLSHMLIDSFCGRPSVERDEVVKEDERCLAQIVEAERKANR
jgi:hypothetical protein